jgi:RND family efflux transporter MFP subunit
LSGYIIEISVREGDHVRAGQTLVRLDPVDINGGIRQSDAAVKAAEAAFRDAEADRVRFQNLFERGSVSENELRKITLKYDAAKESLNQAKAVRDTAHAQREYTELKSPITGTVVTRTKLVGDLALPGVPILTVESGNKLMFDTYVATGSQAPTSIIPGTPVEVQLERIDTPLKGTVSRVVPSADPASRSYQIKVALPDAPGLIPGLYGRAVFPVGRTNLPAVPRHALAERGGLEGVFVLDDENKTHFRWVRVGREWADRVEVTSGVASGERLVANPDKTLRDGDKVLTVVGEAK